VPALKSARVLAKVAFVIDFIKAGKIIAETPSAPMARPSAVARLTANSDATH